jgi:cytochrome c-type biogenesis protein
MLVLVGLLLVTGVWAELVAVLQGPVQTFETPI